MQVEDIYLKEVDSTSNYAKQHAHLFDPRKLTCIQADFQSAGRGRFGRKWESPRGVNLYTTFYFHLPINTLHLMSLGQMAAHSLALILKKNGIKPAIKWPNDILISRKKLAGVLTEMRYLEKSVEVFLGIGVNINMTKEQLDQIDQPATSLKEETHHEWSTKAFLKALQDQLLLDLERFKQSGFSSFKHSFEEMLAFKGEQVRCFDGQKEWVGICHSIANNGQLNLLLPGNTLQTIFSGELFTKQP